MCVARFTMRLDQGEERASSSDDACGRRFCLWSFLFFSSDRVLHLTLHVMIKIC